MTALYEELCLDTDEEKWRALRWEGLTASNVPKLLGQVRFEKTPQEELVKEYADRVDSFERRLLELEAEGNFEKIEELRAVTETGRRWEPHAIAWAAEKMGWTNIRPKHALVQKPGEPWLKASLDTLVTCADGVEAVVECKLHSLFLKKDWWTDERVASLRTPKVPEYVRTQALLEQHLVGAPRLYVVNWYWGAAPRANFVEAQPGELDELLRRCRALWNQVLAWRDPATPPCERCGLPSSVKLDDQLGTALLCAWCARLLETRVTGDDTLE